MKRFIFLLLCGGSAAAVHAQTGGAWSIKSSTIDGGGNVSTGGPWKVTGTIGQPDAAAAKATGGTWSMQGGFWPGTLIFEPGGPGLTISPLGVTRYSIAWGTDAVGHKLQYSANLVTWTDYPGLTIEGASSIVWPMSNGPRYYFRLKRLP